MQKAKKKKKKKVETEIVVNERGSKKPEEVVPCGKNHQRKKNCEDKRKKLRKIGD